MKLRIKVSGKKLIAILNYTVNAITTVIFSAVSEGNEGDQCPPVRSFWMISVSDGGMEESSHASALTQGRMGRAEMLSVLLDPPAAERQ